MDCSALETCSKNVSLGNFLIVPVTQCTYTRLDDTSQSLQPHDARDLPNTRRMG